MPIHITMNDAATWGANFLLSRQGISEQRRDQIMPATKYNLLVKTFNVASVSLVAGVISALFLMISSSFVFLSIGLFLRWTSEKELEKYAIPLPLQGWNAIANLMLLHRHTLHQTTDAEKAMNIYRRVNLPVVENWNQVEVKFLDFDVWRNPVDIPEGIEQPGPQVEQAQAQGQGLAQLGER